LRTTNFKHARWHSDVHGEGFASETEQVDIFSAGFPCQPFSSEGASKGNKDLRSDVVWPIVKYIERTRPRTFFLENVRGLMFKKHQHHLKSILKKLGAIKEDKTGETVYNIYTQILNTTVHGGLPQDRARLYIVGITAKEDNGFTMPRPVKRIASLETLTATTEVEADKPLGAHAAKNLDNARRAIIKSGGNPDKDHYVVDLAHGRARPVYRKNLCPTITRARASCCAFWDTKLKRRLTVSELASLQGCTATLLNLTGVSDAAFGRMVGNAMTVTVVKSLLRKMLEAVGENLD
jgi:DNA (cytosine-5)-methyltransferase 1